LKACGFTPGHAEQRQAEHLVTIPFELLAARNGSRSLAC
jgi:hypothetical protein